MMIEIKPAILGRSSKCCLAMLAAASFSVWAGPTDDLKSLVSQGKTVDAYELGSRHPELLGNTDFDLAFGVAAIDAGHSAEGVLALERYLLLFPRDHQARLELARGYFILGEDARAREEFTAVLALNPPPQVVANINRYMDAIRSREARYQTSARAYIEGGLSNDSNISGGVSNASITLPVLGAVQVAGAGVQQRGNGQVLAAGAQVTHPIKPGVMAFAGVDWEQKDYTLGKAFDTESIGLAGGGTWILGNNLFRATASYSTLDIAGNRYRQVNGGGGEWQYQLNELRTVSAGAQYATIRHDGVNKPRDSNLTGVTFGVRQALALDWQPVVTANLTFADDHNVQARPDLGRTISSARLGVTASPFARFGFSAGYTYQNARYKAPDPLLLQVRDDRSQSIDASLTYLIDRNLSVKLEVTHIENHSSLALYTYRRDVINTKLRYEFK